MSKLGWLTQETIPDRQTVAINLPDDLNWRAQFLGALVLLTQPDNWEEFGTLTPDEMAQEWLDIFLEFVSGEASMIPVGTVLEFAGVNLPDGFLWARGQAVSRETYSRLWDEIGPTFGDGNGVDTFNVPNRCGLVAVGLDLNDTDYDTLDNQGGAKTVGLTIAKLPSHNHLQDAHNHNQNSHNHTQDPHSHTIDGGINAAAGGVVRGLLANGVGSNNTISRSTTATNQVTTATNIATTATNQATGGGEAHENRQPYLTMNFIIKY